VLLTQLRDITTPGQEAERVFCPFVQNVSGMVGQMVSMMERMERETGQTNQRLKALFKEGQLRAKSCAVVSNSGVLLNHTYGHNIDDADLVFRFNDGEVGPSLDEFVGRKDDVRILNNKKGEVLKLPRLGKRLPGSPQALYVLARLHEVPLNLMRLERNASDNSFVTKVLADTQSAHPEAYFVAGNPTVQAVGNAAMHSVFGSSGSKAGFKTERYLTTGFYGMLLAMGICDEVQAYGFVHSDWSSNAPYHYYGKLKDGSADNTQSHKTYDEEKQLWQQVARNRDSAHSDVTVLPGFRLLDCSARADPQFA